MAFGSSSIENHLITTAVISRTFPRSRIVWAYKAECVWAVQLVRGGEMDIQIIDL